MNSITRKYKEVRLQKLKILLARKNAINELVSEIKLGSGFTNKFQRKLQLPTLEAEKEELAESHIEYEIAKLEDEIN